MEAFALALVLAAGGSFAVGAPSAAMLLKVATLLPIILTAKNLHRFSQLKEAGLSRDLQGVTPRYVWLAGFWLICAGAMVCCLPLAQVPVNFQ